MTDKLIEILKASEADGWQIRDVKTEGWEFYYIRHQLDQSRVRDVRHIQLTVYKRSEDGQFIGNASAEIYPFSEEEEIRSLVDSLIYRASLIRNRNYTLTQPSEAEPFDVPKADPAKEAAGFITAIQHLDETAEEDINSYEIFTSKITSRLITSEGIDITETYPSSSAEVIVNARHDGHEIELYRMYRYSTCDGEALQKDLKKTMETGRDRLRAVATPDLKKAAVLFSGENAATLFDYFIDRCDAALICRKMSPYQLNEEIASDIRGDRITLKTVRSLPNSPADRAYDKEGAPIRDLTLIDNGTVRNFVGGRMFSSYIGISDSFIPGNCTVEGGTCSEEQLRKGTWLETSEFSDFQADPVTGDFFGEIRLAYYHDGEKTIPVYGGSVSGNLNELLKDMHMSREQTQVKSVLIPSLVRIENVTVSGSGEN